MIEHTKGKTSDEIESNPLLVDSIMFRILLFTFGKSSLENSKFFLGLSKGEGTSKTIPF